MTRSIAFAAGVSLLVGLFVAGCQSEQKEMREGGVLTTAAQVSEANLKPSMHGRSVRLQGTFTYNRHDLGVPVCSE